MINANEARNKTNELLKADYNKRMENLRVWVERHCDKAIKEAIEARKFETNIEVPNRHNIFDVATELHEKGFTTSICRSNQINRITISWRKN